MSNSAQINSYIPDYLVTPGEVLDEYLESYGMTQAELSDRTGLAKKTINEIIKGKSPITPSTALKLERSLGRPAHFWSNLERQYQDEIARIAEQEQMGSCLEWLKKFPVNKMIRYGWIPKAKDKLDQLSFLLDFFGVASPAQWERVWEMYQVAYRQSKHFEKCAESLSAWLRKGEIEALQIDCSEFDRTRFQGIINEIRELTREKPEIFVPILVRKCASAGVAVVFVPELPGTRVYGATRWLRGRAVVQLSLRYKSNDHLWFTFFHEAAHILKHGRKEIFIEGNCLDKEKEKEADNFARDKLIPPSDLKFFLSNWDGQSLKPIEKFADKLEIAPGIIVGRLQHDNLLDPDTGNKLKVFYNWETFEKGTLCNIL